MRWERWRKRTHSNVVDRLERPELIAFHRGPVEAIKALDLGGEVGRRVRHLLFLNLDDRLLGERRVKRRRLDLREEDKEEYERAEDGGA